MKFNKNQQIFNLQKKEFFSKSKKGGEKLLGENTIGLILAIIGILLIIIILAILAGFQSQNKENEQAKATLQDIVNKITPLNSGDFVNVIVYLPVGWTLVAFDQNTKVMNGFAVPSSFTFKNSLCIFKGTKGKVFCSVVKAPLLDQNQLFIYFIKSYKRFSITYDGNNYKIGSTDLDIKKQDLVDQGVFAGYKVNDGTWQDLGSIDLGAYYTVYEEEYKNKYTDYWKSNSLPDQSVDYYCNEIPNDKKRFYEMVMCYGVGIGENFSLYTRDTIKEKEDDSKPFTDCPDCELGYTDLKTDRTIGRTIFIGKESESLYLGRVVYLELDCSGVEESCKQECQKWNDRYYVIEGIDPTGKLGNKILLFAGGGEERGNYIAGCLPKKAKVSADSIISVDKLKVADKSVIQLS